MKKFLLIIAAAMFGLSANAQIKAPVQTDTLVVKVVRYNYSEIQKDNWPCDVIYKSTTDITIADKTYKINSAREKSFSAKYMAREILFKLDHTPDLSFYENASQRVVVFSGYEFICEPAAGKADIKEKARRVLHAADSLAGVAEEKITESIKSSRNKK